MADSLEAGADVAGSEVAGCVADGSVAAGSDSVLVVDGGAEVAGVSVFFVSSVAGAPKPGASGAEEAGAAAGKLPSRSPLLLAQ